VVDALDYYRQKYEATKEGSKEAAIAQMRRKTSSDFERLASFHLVTTVDSKLLESQIRLQTTKKKGNISVFLIHPEDEVEEGTLFLDLVDASWLVTNVIDLGGVMKEVQAYKVNYTLKWMRSPGEVVETMSRVLNGFAQYGLDINKYLTIPDNQRIILLSLDEKTKTIKRDKRLMIDGIPYIVRKINKFSFEGCLELTLEETLLGEWDSAEICDFNEPIPVPPAPVPTTYMSGEKTIIRGMSESYSLFVGTTRVVSGIVWSINNPDFQIEVQNGIAIVKAPSKISLVGSTVTITSQYFGVSRTLQAKCVSLV